MVYLIHLETRRGTVRHCIVVLDKDAAETLNIYDIQPHSRLMTHLLALGVEWTCIRLWQEERWYKRWLRRLRNASPRCPICGIRC